MARTRRTSSLVRRRSAVIRRSRAGLTWDELEDRVRNDLCFNIHTADGKYWIDPFTGKKAAAAKGDRVAAILHYFQTYDHWQKYPVKSIQELVFWRWVHFLNDHLRNEPRLRFFRGDGHWLNPFTGTWHDGVRRVESRITSMTLHEMAKVLASTVKAGDVEPLPFKQLRAIIEEGHQKLPAQPQGVGTQDLGNLAEGSDPHATDEVGIEDDADATSPEAPPAPPPAAGPSDEEIAEQVLQESGARRAIGPDTQRAQRVQSQLLGDLPTLDGYEIACAYRSMEKVSGDFYDVRKLDDDRVLLAVGDVTGHGVQAALVMATALKALRYIARATDDPIEIICQLNDDIKEDLLADQFITVWFAVLHLQDRRLTCLNAGHHPLAICNVDKEAVLRRVGAKGAALGMAASSSVRKTYQPVDIQLVPGDVLVQYTDGLSEAMNNEEREFGDLRVLGAALSYLEDHDLQGVCDGVINDVLQWTGGLQADDLTMMAVRVLEG